MTSIVRTLVGAGALLGLASLSISIAEAQQSTSKQKATSARAEGRDAEAALDKARRALDEGKAEAAQQLADAVLTFGHKDSRSTARALAIRGEAYLSMGRPAEAVADLESALWLKGGLSGKDRELATAARSKAAQTGGIAGAAPVPSASVSAPQPAAQAAPQVISQAPTPPAVPRQPEPVRQPLAWSNSSVKVERAPPTRVATPESPVATTRPPRRAEAAAEALPSSSWSTSPTAAPPPVRQAEAAGQGGGGITGFFSNLFGGGQSAAQSSDVHPSTTGAVASTATPPRMPAVSSSAPQRSASEAPVSRSSVPPPRSAPSGPPPARAAAMVAPANQVPEQPSEPAPSSEGAYKLQLAAVRSKSEAQAMAQTVRTEEAALVGSRSVEIVEDVYGNMGRFYRVRIGPFAEPTQALSMCASLRERRLDCMVLDR